MKKLLMTTALVGSTLVASNAFAQTTVTGNLNISYKAISAEPATTAALTNSQRGFGNEVQLNIQNKGKLNNGMDYAAGFSIENDSQQTATQYNENIYIDFIAGNTTITFGQDHIQNIDRTTSTLVTGMEAGDLVLSGTAAGSGQSIFLTAPGADPAQAFGAGIVQTIPGFGKVSALYVPSNSNLQTGTGGDKSVAEGDVGAHEIGFVGDFGVKGLNVHLFRNEAQKVGTENQKAKGENYGLSYNFGQVTVGYDLKKAQGVTTNSDTKQNGFGLAFAVSPNLTLGANYTKADKDGLVDAKSKALQLGYSLGPVSLVAAAAKQENVTGVSGVDKDVIYLAARTNF